MSRFNALAQRGMSGLAVSALLLALLVPVLGGCSNEPRLFHSMDELRSGVANEKTKLTFVYAGGDSIGNLAFSKVVEGFNRSQQSFEIVEITSPPGSPTYDEFLKKLAAMGELADIVEVRNPQLFADKGIIQPLPDSLTTLLKAPKLVNGKVYTAPQGGRQPLAILYNKTIFEQAGITEYPQNWEQFLELCETLKRQGYTPLAVAGKDLWHLGFWQSFFMGSSIYSGNENWNAQKKQGLVSFQDDNMLQAMADMTELWEKGYVNADWASVADSDIPAYLGDGKAAMVYHGNWMAATIKQVRPDFRLGAFFPKDRNGWTIVLDEYSSAGLSLTTKAYEDPVKREGFQAFIEYFYGKENYTEYLRLTRNTDVTKQGIVYDEMRDFPVPSLDDAGVKRVLFMHEYEGEGAITSEFRDWLWRLMHSWLATGRPSIKEAMARADGAFQSYLQGK